MFFQLTIKKTRTATRLYDWKYDGDSSTFELKKTKN